MKVAKLLKCESFDKIGEQEAELLHERFMGLDNSFFGTLRGCSEPRKLGKLLDIVGMIVSKIDDFLAGVFRDVFPRGRESL